MQLYKEYGFTEQEELYNHVSHERFLEFIKQYPVIEIERGTNSYGEFTFVYLRAYGTRNDGSKYTECITFYGNGTHEYRDITPSYWWFNIGNGFLVKDKKALNKKTVIKQIENERKFISFDDAPKNNKYTFIADLTDDDYALVNDWE